MPEVHIKIVWPGKQVDTVYSPSTIIKNYFKTGDILTVTEFESKAETALSQASKRVRERFGYECTSAMSEMARLKKITGSIEDKNLTIEITDIG